MKKLYLLIALAILNAIGLSAQIVTSSPAIITQSSTDIVLTYHPDDPESNGALANLPASTTLYAHIGLITDKSSGPSDWQYAPTWKDNNEKYKLTYVSPNNYTLKIGDFKSYFGLKDGEVVKSIALVFRTEDASKEGKTKNGGDIFVDVYEDGFNLSFQSSIAGGIASVGESVALSLSTSATAEIVLSVNGNELAKTAAGTELSHTYKFSAIDSYHFKATAKHTTSGETITKEILITVPDASKAVDYPGGTPKMGAVKNADGSVTFCLAAPNKKSVIIVPSWHDYEVRNENVMAYQDYNGNRYFWITVSGLDNATAYPYYYIVDGEKKVADPYAKLVLDCYSDKFLDENVWPDCPAYPYDKIDGVMLAVYQGNINDYEFSEFTIPDHKNLIIYEMLFRDFTGTEGEAKADGTVRKAIEKIPYLVQLGVNAVELMPIMEFNGNNSWGYNTNFYFAPDKAYGSPKDYKDFIETCHKNGIAVILDIVFNQSDGLHPWYQMYPIESNPFYNQYAPHDYSVLNDWKQDNALVQQQWDDVLRYWLKEYNVDGFRFDLVKGLGDNDSYKNGTEAYNQSRVDRMKRLHGIIKEVKPNGIHINEHLAGASEETPMAQDGQLLWGNFNYAGTQFAICKGESDLKKMYDGWGRPAGSVIGYIESHDEQRVGYNMNSSAPTEVRGSAPMCKRLGSLAAQLLMVPGPKMIWQFGELGDKQNNKTSYGNNTDPKNVNWSNLEKDSYGGLYKNYSALASLRTDNPDLFGEGVVYSTTGMDGSESSPRVISVRNGKKEVIAFINSAYKGDAVTISAKAEYLSASNSQLITTSTGTTPVLTGSGTVYVSLEPNSMAVFATADVAGVEEIIPDADAPACAVYGAQGEIIIVGEYNQAQAYTLDGRQTADLTNLAAGIYIVRVDNTSFKVAVK